MLSSLRDVPPAAPPPQAPPCLIICSNTFSNQSLDACKVTWNRKEVPCKWLEETPCGGPSDRFSSEPKQRLGVLTKAMTMASRVDVPFLPTALLQTKRAASLKTLAFSKKESDPFQ